LFADHATPPIATGVDAHTVYTSSKPIDPNEMIAYLVRPSAEELRSTSGTQRSASQAQLLYQVLYEFAERCKIRKRNATGETGPLIEIQTKTRVTLL
jgi:hypothetical protein